MMSIYMGEEEERANIRRNVELIERAPPPEGLPFTILG